MQNQSNTQRFKTTCLLALAFLCTNTFAHSHDYYMQKLLPLAEQNPKWPFAAMIVNTKTGEILCEGLNHTHDNPTFHGEIVAINACAAKYPNMQWQETTLYTTAEPCPMCQSAIIWAVIPHVVFGTSILTLKKEGMHQIDITAEEVSKKAPFYHGDIVGGVLKNQTDPLFRRKS